MAKTATSSYRRLLARYLGPEARRVALLGALMLAAIGLQLANPQILRYFIDTARAGGLFLGLALATQLCAVAEAYVAENLGLTATNRLRADLTLHVLQLDPAFHNTHTPGELIERVDGDVATLANFFSRFVVNLFGN